MAERVFITGMGVVSSVGNDVATFWDSLLQGQSGIDVLQNIDVSDMSTRIGGEVRDLDERLAEVGQVKVKRLDRASLFAVIAAGQALRDAALQDTELDPTAAVILGSGLSGLMTLQLQTERLLARGPRGVSPFTIPMLMPNAAAANVSMAYGIRGTCFVVGSACASSGHAIIEAAELIRRGGADMVVSGGTEASLTRLGISAFANMQAMTKRYNDNPKAGMRPFDANRDGFIMSEGAAIVVLESEASLKRRGVKPHAEFLGAGASSDAHHITQPEETGAGAARAIAAAVQSAGLNADSIAGDVYVNAHGTSTPYNDRIETRALRTVFGPAADRLQVSSTKSVTGHMIGAAAAVETIASVRALQTGVLPPTVNYETPDPDCDLDCIPNTPRETPVRYAINNTLGFGGHNVSLLFGRVER